jgi:type II secretory pathway pseudopilin PulG
MSRRFDQTWRALTREEGMTIVEVLVASFLLLLALLGSLVVYSAVNAYAARNIDTSAAVRVADRAINEWYASENQNFTWSSKMPAYFNSYPPQVVNNVRYNVTFTFTDCPHGSFPPLIEATVTVTWKSLNVNRSFVELAGFAPPQGVSCPGSGG